MKFDFKALSQKPAEEHDGESSEMIAGQIALEKSMRGEELAPAGAIAMPGNTAEEGSATAGAVEQPTPTIAPTLADLLKASASQPDIEAKPGAQDASQAAEVTLQGDATQDADVAALAATLESAKAASEDQIAEEGAKQLVEAARLSLSAHYADDSRARSREIDQAREMEAEAYKKLGTVDVRRAGELVAIERAKITKDSQLQGSIRFDTKKYQAAGGQLAPEQKSAQVNLAEGVGKGAAAPKLDFSTLLRRSAGKISEAEMERAVPPVVTLAKAGMFSGGVMASEEDDVEVDQLVRAVQKKHDEFNAAGPKGGAAPQAAVGGAANVPAPQFATTIGGMAGRVAGEIVATPFIALSSAAKHLSQRFGGPLSALPAGPAGPRSSMIASTRNPSLANTLETITHWKCDRIEKAANDAINAASALTSTEEFVVWEDKVRAAAARDGRTPAELVSRMHEDADLADLKAGMDSLWAAHPDKVAAYRDAGDAFVRGINSVVKEFPNSDEQMQERVGTSISNVMEKTEMLPGFGAEQGEYNRKLAERIREIVRAIAEFIQRLTDRLTGKQSTPEMTV